MRIFVATLAILGLFATATKAADEFIKLPDDSESKQVYLFQLKKSNILMNRPVKEFCSAMNYGDFVAGRSTEIVEDHKAIEVIDWVICRMSGGPQRKPKCDPSCKQN